MNQDWELARIALERLQARLTLAKIDSEQRHEIGNLLAISQANIEAVQDGVVEATPQRLRNIEAALLSASNRL
ncbi:MAG: hypothetical protein M3N19_08660 [Candidatus Eremiobacteraeota bacterium]|nr:hypothetical protein [Candidatus Eremiobacteraeota bacterium]